MSSSHSFFISEEKYLINLEGLLKYLAEKINLGFLCIYCDNQGTKGFKTGSAVQNHMLDKCHCFMNTEYFDEYEDFFDFSSQFEELEKEDNLTRKLAENKDIHYDIIKIEKEGKLDENHGNDEEWEDEIGSDEKKTGKKYRLYKIRKAKLLDNGEILLPNGKTLGNRTYNKIYSQKHYFRTTPINSERIKSLLGRSHENRAISVLQNSTQMILLEKMTLLQQRKMSWKMKNFSDKITSYNTLHLSMRANSLQHHLRKQNP